MRIMISDENGHLILEADVDTQNRRVTTLNLEESYPAVVAAFVGLAVLSGYVANELQDGDITELWKVGSGKTIRKGDNETGRQSDWGNGDPVGFPGNLWGRPSVQEMATAMGLVPCKAEWDHECSACWESTIDWMKESGQVLEGFCNACLPAVFDLHVINQAELDRLVEDEEPNRSNGADRTNRPEAPTCEGGCE